MEFSRKAQQALDEKESRRLEELRIMNEKMKARERHGEALGASQVMFTCVYVCACIHGTCMYVCMYICMYVHLYMKSTWHI